VHTPAITTQQAVPSRATWRTVVQTVVSAVLVLGIILPIVVGIIDEELGGYLPDGWVAWLYGAAALVAAIAGALARIMAIPAVDAFLERVLHLGSAPEVDKARDMMQRAQGGDVKRASIRWHNDPPES
jgi:hypothetical protein